MAEGLVVAGEALVVVGATFTIVPAASHSLIRRTIRSMRVHNRDAGAIELTVRKTVNGSDFIMEKKTLAAGETWVFGDKGEIVTLVGTGESVTGFLTVSPAVKPHVTASWEDSV